MGYLAEPWTSWTSARETKESGGMRMTWCLWGLDLNPKSVIHGPELLNNKEPNRSSTWWCSGIWYCSTGRNPHN